LILFSFTAEAAKHAEKAFLTISCDLCALSGEMWVITRHFSLDKSFKIVYHSKVVLM